MPPKFNLAAPFWVPITAGVDLPDVFARKHPLRNDGLCQVLPKYHKASALSFKGCRKLNVRS